jgi:PfaD family protein
VALVLLPAMHALRDREARRHGFARPPRVGLAGGLGTPAALAAAFAMGADFVLTGSINQCTAEAGTSDAVKELLAQAGSQDTDFAPAGDMFEIGARVQVLRRGLLFSARANRLYEIWRRYDSLEEVPAETLQQIERQYWPPCRRGLGRNHRPLCRCRTRYPGRRRSQPEAEAGHGSALVLDPRQPPGDGRRHGPAHRLAGALRAGHGRL